jgi:DUF4097 and DUF4098 domain-containing protein YvlB
MNRATSLLLAICALLPSTSTAQSSRERERRIERRAEEIARSVERSVTAAAERVGRALEDAFAEWDEHEDRRDRDQQGQDYTQRLDTAFAFPRDGVIDLSNTSGDIVVTGSAREQVRINATTERGRLRWSFSRSRVSIEVESVRGRMGETRYDLTVPEGVRVIVRSTSGDIRLTGTKGAVDARTVSGDVEVSDASDRVLLETVSGEVRASRLRGDIDLSSTSGGVELDDVEGTVRVESTSSDVIVTRARVRGIDASTVSGDVEYDGTIESGGQYEFNSHSGDIVLQIPTNTSARFSVETYSGDLETAFPITLTPEGSTRANRRPRRFDFSLGGGEARVIAESFSGNIDIRRGERR